LDDSWLSPVGLANREQLLLCRDRTLGASESNARSATACTATRSASGAAPGDSLGASAEAGTVMAVSIASRMLSDIRGSRCSGDMAASVSTTPVPAA
jgi:hypothetical protein